ncbi:hypothetical protein T36_0487 [Helicobacter cinaedi]|uniref:hypothetical protein n=1 Tax=Helicobacter TaxID=209 RepID=UPI001F30956C|nr:hypothetical protein [Helicobacter cinaedi]BDB64040.1 hypothetical protein T36_0487 [Helicobacter cinaedi]
MFLYKKCEVCGNKINKLQSIWNIYTLKMGKVIQCTHCSTYYKTNQIIESFSSIYINTGIGIIFWLIVGICFTILLPTTINQSVKFIVALLFSFIFLSFMNFIIACVIPLHKTQPPQKIRKQSFYWVAMGILAIILIAFLAGFLGIKF